MANPEGSVYLINDYDNHQIHVKEHNHYRKKIEYQRVKTDNPEMFMSIETRFMEHLQMHQTFVDQQIAQMMQRESQMNNKGGESNAGKAKSN